jgi:hypothetical protein
MRSHIIIKLPASQVISLQILFPNQQIRPDNAAKQTKRYNMVFVFLTYRPVGRLVGEKR